MANLFLYEFIFSARDDALEYQTFICGKGISASEFLVKGKILNPEAQLLTV